MPGFRYKKTLPAEQKKKMFTNGEKAGMALSLALLLFGISDGDLPLCFFVGSFLVYEAHVMLKKVHGDEDWFLSNMLKGLSWAMFFGSIVVVLFYQ